MKPSDIRISVIIPCFNAAGFLRQAVASVTRQGIEQTEILVVDDASTDDTVAVAEELARKAPHLRVLRQSVNEGPARARNRGLQEARGRFVCFLDADDSYGDSVFATALAFLEAKPWIPAVDFPIRLVNSHREVPAGLLGAITNSIPSNLIVLREIAQSIGGFPEDAVFRTKRAGEDIAFRRALREWGSIHRLDAIFLDYTVRRGSHFDVFLDTVRIEGDKLEFAPLADDHLLVRGQADHIARVRNGIKVTRGIEKTRVLVGVSGNDKYYFETFDNGASIKHAMETLNGTTYPKIPFLVLVNSILDIGANIGSSAVFFSSLYPNARIVAIEPARQPFTLLRVNTLARSNVKAFNIGLFDRTMRRPIFIGAPDAVTNSVFRNVLSSNATEEIQLVAADVFTKHEGIDRPDIIKIDTEGCEIAIMSVIPESFRGAKAVYLEYHSESDRRQIDQMLCETHILYQGKIVNPHRGELLYVRNDVFPSPQERDRWKIGG